MATSLLDLLTGNQNGWQSQQEQTPISNLSNWIQEQLGSRQPYQPGTAGDALAGRFDTGVGDYAQGVVQSALGKPTLGPQIADQRINDQLKQLSAVSGIQKDLAYTKYYGSGGKGQGATMAIADALIAQGIDPVSAISFAKSGIGQGNTMVNGQVTPITGAPQSAYTMANYKEGGQRDAELKTAGPIGFAKNRSEAAGKVSIENNKSTVDLENLGYSINQAKLLLPKVALTGPILGRAGNAANDPDYANLQGALNGITLQAKELYNLGSGQGFSDADRDFLGEVIAGKYSRAETIDLALNRMANLAQKRSQFLGQQNQGFTNEFNYTGNQGGIVNLPGASDQIAPPTPEELAEYKRIKGHP